MGCDSHAAFKLAIPASKSSGDEYSLVCVCRVGINAAT
jgi:hypothetical protein